MTQASTTIYSAPGFSDHILDLLYDMQQTEKFCDLRLDAKNGMLRTHSLVLLANSTFFQKWILHQGRQSELSYDIPDLTLDELKGVVQFLYTGRLVLHEDNVDSYMAFFEKLAIVEAVNLCHEFLTSRSREIVTEKETGNSAGNIKSDESQLSDEQTIKSDGKLSSERIADNTVTCKLQYYDSQPEDDASVAMTTELQQSDTPKRFSMNDCVTSDNKLFLCQSSVKLEKVDDGFTDLKNVDSIDEKLLPQIENPLVSVPDISMTYATDLGAPPVKRRRGRPAGQCKARKNQFKLRCKGRKLHSKGKNKIKNNVKCSTKQVVINNSDNDSVDISDGDVKSEFPELHKSQKKMRRRQVYSRNYSCEFCGHKSIRFMELESHRHSKHDIPFDESKYTVYRCEICNFETNIPKRLEKHLATHTEDRPNICEHCGKTFKLANELNAHVQSHIFPEKFSCHICGKSFSSPFIVKDHIANIHLGHKKQFLCHLCCHVTADNRNLTLHLWQKHQIPVPQKCKLFKCDECDFETLRKHKFTVHKKLHTGVRDHVCEVCGKGYLTGGALRSHMLWHSDKIHQCTFEPCNYSSPSKRQLEQHVRLMHTQRDMKPFACHLCSHRCSVRGNLDKHLRTVHSLNIPDKRRLSHLYNLGRCGRSRIPASENLDVAPETLSTTNVNKPSTCSSQTNKDVVEETTVSTMQGQGGGPGDNDFSIPYTGINFQNYYQNIHY
ncbi:zinc finger and BTB domain-containing protein 41-like isoform X2 [Gigantopelta aegis]|nr:zinc finger and BTB domain-containing protein 41-like isoform X2 [Gigantopelta aegis]